MLPVTRCPACGGGLHARFSVETDDRVMSVSSCTRCGSFVKTPYFDADELRGIYAHYDHHERHFQPGPGEIDNLVSKVRRIERFVPSRGKLLEIGCGRGFFLAEALRRGWDVQGVELVGSAAENTLPEIRGKIQFIRSEEDFAKLERAAYEVVCSYQVFEHLIRPAASLQSWVRAAKPGGVIVVDTPNGGGLGARRHKENWVHHRRADHFVLYTRRALEGMLRESGASVVHCTYGGAPAVCAVAAGGAATSARRVFRYRGLTRVLRSLVQRLGLGDNLEIIARRKGT